MNRRELVIGIASALAFKGLAGGAVRGDEAMYVGGTLTHIPERTEGRFDIEDEKVGRYSWPGGEVTIDYRRITSLEYGQKAGRRVGLAIVVSPVLLFSKKRKHFLTLGFVDEMGAQQAGVFEIAKGKVRGFLTILQTRSGKQVEFESEEARKLAGV